MKKKTREEKQLTKLKIIAVCLGMIALGLYLYAYYPRELSKKPEAAQIINDQITTVEVENQDDHGAVKSLDHR